MVKFIVLILLSITLGACSSLAAEELPIEMNAYNSLSDNEQELIPTSPKDSTVTKETVSTEIKSKINTDYDGEKVYSVIFNDTATNGSGNLIVFVDLDKKTVLGKGFGSSND